MPAKLPPDIVLHRETVFLEMRAKGASAKEIAKELHLSIASIDVLRKTLRKQGKIAKSVSGVRREKILELIKEGCMAREIANMLGICTQTVYCVSKSEGSPLEKGKRVQRYATKMYTKPQNAANLSWAKILYELIATGDTLKTVGDRLGISPQRVHEILKMAKYHKIPVHASRYSTEETDQTTSKM